MQAFGGTDQFILTWKIEGGKRSASRPGRFIPRESAPNIHKIGRYVDPRAGWAFWS